MTTAIKARIGAVFVPVSDIEAAKRWYAQLLGIGDLPETQFGHLATFPVENGLRLVLDARIHSASSTRDAPLFHFVADDIAEAYDHVLGLGVEIVTPVQFGHWFSFRDPDGNVLMACVCD